MANCLTVIIRNSKKFAKPSAANLAHNSGHKKATYWLGDGTDLMQSQKFRSVSHLNEMWSTWTDEADTRYNSAPGRKRKLGTDAVRLEEGMIVLGTDVIDLPTKDIKKIINNFIKKFEKDNNTKVKHWAYHDHEGHKDNDIDKINRHIHFIFDNVSKSGEMVRRNWERSYLKQLQDDIHLSAKSVIPGIERATDYAKLGKSAPKQKHHKQYRIEKETKRLHKNEDYLKVEMTKLRAELKENEAVREDYAKLEQLNRDLKQQIKNKDLKIDDLEKKLINARETILNQNTTISLQKIRLNELEQTIQVLEAKNNANYGMNNKIKEELQQKQNLLSEILEHFESNHTFNAINEVTQVIKENININIDENENFTDDDIQNDLHLNR